MMSDIVVTPEVHPVKPEEGSANSTTRGRCKPPWFYVEPVLILFNIVVMATSPLQSQYIYSRLLGRYNESTSEKDGR